MIRILVRRSRDLGYLTDDAAHELDGVRDGAALWWPKAPVDSANVAEVLDRNRAGAVVGYDIIIAAPRPVSVLLAVGTPCEQRAVVQIHRESVKGALAYLDDTALVVQRTILGERDELTGHWRSAAGFTHGVNRSGEPHLHDHVLVGAKPREYPQSIDSWTLFAHAASADALYRSSLREGITRELERPSWRSFRGVEYVGGVDEGLRALWPGRASDREQKRSWSRGEITSRWARDLTRYEPGPQVAPPRERTGLLHEHSFDAQLSEKNSIRRRDLVEAWSNAATFGARAPDVTRAIERWYPELTGIPDARRSAVTLSRAAMYSDVASRGARPLAPEMFDQWRPRERSRDSLVRERER